MAQLIKKFTKPSEAQKVINEEWERLQAVEVNDSVQRVERDRLCNAIFSQYQQADRGILGYDSEWLRSMNNLLNQGYKFREEILRPPYPTWDVSTAVPLHTVRVEFSKGDYTVTTDLNDFMSGSGRTKLLEATHENGAKLVLKRIAEKPYRQWPLEFKEKRNRDINLWADLQHSSILPFLGTTQIEGYFYAVSKLAPRGDFLDALQHISNLPVMDILWRTADAIRYMHEFAPPLIHGDIKPENIFLEDDFNPLLSDFANMKRLGHDTTAERRTEASVYIKSPEAWGNKTRTRETDVYAFGITIAWALLKGAAPFAISASGRNMYTAVVVQGLRPVPPPGGFMNSAERDAWNVATRCWAQLPEGRPTIQEVVKELKPLP